MKSGGIVFKGGTCLRKVHGLNRFSEDLDFNIVQGDPVELLKDGMRGFDRTGIEAEVSHRDERRDVFLAKIRYQGPLYSGNDISKGTLQIEMSKHRIHRDPSWITMVEDYADIGTYSTMTMSTGEILGEKFRSLVQRDMPRDLYDIWFLFKKGNGLDRDLLRKKFEDVEMKPLSPADILKRYDLSKERWETDLEDLMNRVPDKGKVLKDARETLGIS